MIAWLTRKVAFSNILLFSGTIGRGLFGNTSIAERYNLFGLADTTLRT